MFKYHLVRSKFIAIVLVVFMLVVVSPIYASDTEKAIAALKNNEVKTAIIHLKNQLKQNPKDAQARFILGDIYFRTGKIEASLKELGRAHQYDEASIKYLFRYADALQRSGQYKEVINLFNQTQSIDKNNSKRQAYLAYAHLGLNDVKQAKTLLNQANKPGDDVMALTGLTRIALQENELTQAGDYLTRALKLAPEDVASLKLQAKLNNLNKLPEQALAVYNNLLEKNNSDLGLYLDRAMTLLLLKRGEQAKQDIQTVLSKVKVHPQANLMLAQLYLEEKNFNEAQINAQQVLNVVPANAQALLILGTANLGLNNLLQAEKHLTSYLAHYPEDLRGQSLLANVYLAQKKPKQALLIVEGTKAEIADKSLPLLLTLADSYFALNNYKQGLISLKKAQALAPNNEQIQKRLIGAQLQSGQIDAAIDDLEALSDSGKAKNNDNYLLISSYIKQNKLDKAQQKITSLMSTSTDNTVLQNLDALVSQLKGNYEQAQSKYENILKNNQRDIPARMGFARLFVSQKNWEEASQLFQQVVSIKPDHIKAYMGLAGVAQKQENIEKTELYFQQAIQAAKGDLKNKLAVIDAFSRWYASQKQQGKILELANTLNQEHPNNTNVLAFLAKAQLINKEKDQAINTLKQLILEDTQDLKHRVLLAKILATNKETNKQAMSLIEETIELSPKNKSLYIVKMELLLKNQHYTKALEVSQALQNRFEKDNLGIVLEADVYRLQKQYKKALPLYQKAYKDKPNNKIFGAIVDTLIKLKQNNKAIKILLDETQNKMNSDISKENRTKIDLVSNLFKLASLYHQDKKITQAQKQYENLLNLEPTHVATLNNLAWIVIDTNLTKAVSMAQRANAAAPNSAAIKDTYGYFLVKSGELSKGLILLKEAAKSVPEDNDIQYHLAYALQKSGDKKAALVILQKLSKVKDNFSEKKNVNQLLKKLS